MSQIQFIHRRPFTTGGPYVPASRGGFTIAYQEVKPGEIEYSVAKCSTNDNFNKKIGRDVATGRLVNSRHNARMQATVAVFRERMYEMSV